MTPVVESFVMHFGEMGSRWGFNRTVGQLYALLVVTEAPMTANQLSETLNISRGNVSMGVKELQAWRLVKVSHVAGDRKDYFSALGTIWDMANRVLEERRKREIEPTLSLLRNLLLERTSNDTDMYAHQQLEDIHGLLEQVDKWTIELQGLQPESLKRLMMLGNGVGKILDLTKKLKKDG
jgi:DNA-binding transcriptional regulator GbsR (MarR family)